MIHGNSERQREKRYLVAKFLAARLAVTCWLASRFIISVANGQPTMIEETLPKVAKVFGSGGLHRLESWQTAVATSGEGMFVTAWSYVLDAGVTVVLHDGRRFEAQVLGHHPRLEIALLKIDIIGQPHFRLDSGTSVTPGLPVLAFSNLYGVATGNEAVSVQHGIVSATIDVATQRGPRASGYSGPAVIVDAIISNPGAAGGALTDRQGNFLGLIGRESTSSRSGLWLNYAIPAAQVDQAVKEILSGRASESLTGGARPSEPVTLELLGLLMVPAVASPTPPWIEQVIAGSPADRAGLRSDDLILEVNGTPSATRERVLEQLAMIDRDRKFTLTIKREGEFIPIEVSLNR